jgi:chorismate mutase/catechol 2,3-dioxygenase-like lactoylglutathione lyase family enzyme
MADLPDLQQLRHQLDLLDRELIDVLARRLQVCREVAAVKEHSDVPVIQPARVRDVLTSRRQMAIEAGVDADFAEQIVRVLLTETHRIEVAGQRPDPAPEKSAEGAQGPSALDTVASRIDHVVIAVDDLDDAAATLHAHFGFHVDEFADGPVAGMAALSAGGVTLVLVGPDASPAVAHYLRTHGPGVQHLAIEVLNAGYARASLAESGAPLLTDVVVDEPGHEQFFAARDPRSGLQFGFISRTGHRVGVGAANVLALFDAAADTAAG